MTKCWYLENKPWGKALKLQRQQIKKVVFCLAISRFPFNAAHHMVFGGTYWFIGTIFRLCLKDLIHIKFGIRGGDSRPPGHVGRRLGSHLKALCFRIKACYAEVPILASWGHWRPKTLRGWCRFCLYYLLLLPVLSATFTSKLQIKFEYVAQWVNVEYLPSNPCYFEAVVGKRSCQPPSSPIVCF